ncbi:serine hydrolase domain-containing protein [Phreatobacter stygius]|nr:serine hydrolase domain-containing protein [Phreatobacter stygius]
MRLLVAVFTIVFLATAQAQPAVPETKAAAVFAAWLDAFNSADAVKVGAFDRTYRPAPSLAQLSGLRRQSGGFVLVRVVASEASRFTGLLKEVESQRFAQVQMALTGDPEPVLASFALDLVPPPADLAVQRLSEADAVAQLVSHLDEAARRDRFAGAVLVARDGKVLLERAWGLADRARNLPATVETRFRIGSMSKMFTAVAVLQLVEAGKLGLDDTVGRHLAGYPNRAIAETVTIRQLLTHTGGTGDIFGPGFAENRHNLRTHDDYVRLYGERAPDHPPGAGQRYSNYGFILLGALIETASGMSYDDYVRRHLFEPAGMTSTGSLPESEAVPERAVGYISRGNELVPNSDTLPWRGTSAGGGYSTVGDLLRFVEALQAGRLISPALFQAATRRQAGPFGLGFAVVGDGDWQGFGHNGGAPGMSGDLHVFPRLGYVLVALANLDPPASSRPLEFIEPRLPEAR